MKKFIVFSILFLIIAAPFGLWRYFDNKGEVVSVDIPQGISAAKIADILKEKEIIQSPLWFKICLKASGAAPMLRSGNFKLNKNTAAPEVIWRLISDSGAQLQRIVVLEGWRIEEIADELFKNGIINNTQDFIRQAKDENLEGYLFPSTYFLSPNMPISKILRMMTDEYDKNIKPLIKAAGRMNDEKQILTVASIVEREAVVDDERPKIAAVYLNRLKIGKRLEADPTVQYALGFYPQENRHWKRALTLKDLRINSPYNTYRNSGLPPGPIANPSVESVKAVLNPQPNFDALYFVADNKTGRHIFSKTYNQHIQTIRAVRSSK